MNHQGFTLIEVLLAVAITGFMATVLFSSLLQINSSVNITESIMTVNEKAARLQQLFERDLSGATTLLDNEPPKKQDKDLKATPTGAKQEPAEKTGEEKSTEKKEKPLVKKIFYSTTKGNQLGTLTFISNNPLLGFCSTQAGSFQAGKAKPCLARITYELADDPLRPGAYILRRQESIPLDFEQRSGRSYEVLEGIKSLSFKYTAKTIKTIAVQDTTKQQTQNSHADEQPKQPQQPKEEIALTSNLSTWNTDEQSEAEPKKEEPKEKKLPLPVFVDIEVILWDDAQQREYTYVFTIEIITDTEFTQKRRAWSFMSLFDKNKQPQQAQQNPVPQKPVPAQPKQVGFNPYRPNSQLQKQLNDLFKTAQEIDKRMLS
jgi:prepilin-type N-terminal cleavage/methylation domain-containing protein